MEEERTTESTPGDDGSVSKLYRKALERNRRLQMKDLFSKLASLITPTSLCKIKCSHVLVDEVINYIKRLQERVERLKQRKELLERTEEEAAVVATGGGSISPVVTVKDLGFIFDVCVVCGLQNNLTLYQVINVLMEEEAEVVSVSHLTVGGRVSYTIYFQAVSSRIGIEIPRLQERLKELIL